MRYSDMTTEELIKERDRIQNLYQTCCAQNLSLDLTRGKPSLDQLDLSNQLDGILNGFYLLQDGTDVRNYGGLRGIPEARRLGAQILDVHEDQVLVGGNSSLQLMYLYIDHMLNHGIDGQFSAWRREAVDSHSKVKFLCPVPGYDRHFQICEQLGIEMICVPMTHEGPDMDMVRKLVERDPLIKGIWCVPRYSNPTGATYSDKVVRALAEIPKYSGDHFRIMWDNAYAVHHINSNYASLLNVIDECAKQNTEDNVIMLASTSKITFAGAGVSFLAGSELNLKAFEQFLSTLTIGFDKVNQLRHARFLENKEQLKAHMKKHAAIIKPKFDLVDSALNQALAGKEIANWTKPDGGYFVSLNTLPGLAQEVIQLAADAGVKLTPAGATFPYGVDPENSNIRIAPTYPSITDLRQALEVLVLCIQLVSANYYLKDQPA